MGCDIHLYVEQKINNKWTYLPPPNSEKDEKIEELDWYIQYANEYAAIPWNMHRNYDLFAILADVRNGRGFAGIKTGGGFNPISEPRGTPDDISNEIKTESDNWGSDGHSHSWFTLKELKEYDYTQKTTHSGWVNDNEYKQFKEKGHPDSWCGHISGNTVNHIDNESMDKILSGEFEKVPDNTYFTEIEWGVEYKNCINDLYWKLLDILAKIEPNSENIRIVFWFDN